MANEKPQNLQNHARLVAPFHMFVLPVFLLNAGSSIYRVIKDGISLPIRPRRFGGLRAAYASRCLRAFSR